MHKTTVAAVAAVAVVALAFGLRLADGLAAGLDLDVLVPSLIAAACLCVTGLARRVAPSVAAFSLGLGALLGAIETIAVVRAWLPATVPGDRPVLVALAGGAGVAATLVAWRYFAASLGRPGTASRRRRETLGTALVVGIVAVGYGLAIAGAPTDAVDDDSAPASPLRVATRLMLGIASGSLLLGATAVALPRLGRAWRRGHVSRSLSLVDAIVAEFAPGIGASRRAAEAERARLAADLHARVVPELRQAVAAASAGSSPEITGRLRSTLDDVEQLMATRHSVLLDELGLVAAVEWLAERTEARAGVVVTIEIDPATSAVRPLLAAERAAFRIAVLAVDNAVRHAEGSPITIAVTTTPDRISLNVADAGPGFDPVVALGKDHGGEHRGLVDMRAECDAVGGRLRIDAMRPGGAPGAEVAFDWPARR